MTVTQALTLAAVAVAAALIYLPWSKLLPLMKAGKPDSLSQIQSVLRIRDNTASAEVRNACTVLLEALLK